MPAAGNLHARNPGPLQDRRGTCTQSWQVLFNPETWVQSKPAAFPPLGVGTHLEINGHHKAKQQTQKIQHAMTKTE